MLIGRSLMCSRRRVQQGLSLAAFCRWLVWATLRSPRYSPAASLLGHSESPPVSTGLTEVELYLWGLCSYSGVVSAFVRGSGCRAVQTYFPVLLPLSVAKPKANLHTSLGFLFCVLEMFPLPWRVLKRAMLLSSHGDFLSFLQPHQATFYLGPFALAVPLLGTPFPGFPFIFQILAAKPPPQRAPDHLAKRVSTL